MIKSPTRVNCRNAISSQYGAESYWLLACDDHHIPLCLVLQVSQHGQTSRSADKKKFVMSSVYSNIYLLWFWSIEIL